MTLCQPVCKSTIFATSHIVSKGLIAVCTYCLVMISIDLSETTQKSTLDIWDKIQDNLFSDKEICLRLNFVSDWICLRLNFVLDYIPQLYFICNHIIILVKDLN